MYVTDEQISFYHDNGFLLVDECFSPEEVDRLKCELPRIFAEDSPRRVLEKNGLTVRSVYGSHLTNEVFRALATDARLVDPAARMVGTDVYTHQCKINAKARFDGDIWRWHQDYIFWLREDGLRKPDLVTAMVFLDDVTDFNGPLFFIPRSHKVGVVDVPGRIGTPDGYEGAPSWISNVTADLKYSLDMDSITHLATRHGMVASKGRAGSVLFFHANIFHASPPNLSPFDRSVALLSYNSVDNPPPNLENARPDFLCGRDFRPLKRK